MVYTKKFGLCKSVIRIMQCRKTVIQQLFIKGNIHIYLFQGFYKREYTRESHNAYGKGTSVIQNSFLY